MESLFTKRMKKVCLAASGGGHLMEILMLVPAVKHCDFYIVTEKNVASEAAISNYRHYYVLQQERRQWIFVFKFVYNIVVSLFYLLKERPNYILCTGAGAAFPTCCWAKVLGVKVIFLESFARSKQKSKTGEMMYLVADHFLVQWKEMLQLYPKASYHGTVY